MPIFNDLYYSTPGTNYVKKPIQDFVNAGSALNQVYDKNKSEFDIQQALYANLSARNDVLNKQQREEYDKAYENFKPYIEAGNYEDANGVASKTALQVASNPILKAIAEDKAAYVDFIKYNQDRLKGGKDGKISENDFKREVERINKHYADRIEYDPITGQTKNKFNGASIPDNIDGKEKALEIVKQLESGSIPLYTDAKGNPVFMKKSSDGAGYIESTTSNGVSADRIENAVRGYLRGNEDLNRLYSYRAALDADLRDEEFTKYDLQNYGLMDSDGIPTDMEEGYKLLNTGDGSVNQEEAKNQYINAKVNAQMNDVVDYAKSFAYQNYKVDDRIDKNYELWADKEKIRYADSFKRQEDLNTRSQLYPSLFMLAPGTSSVLTQQSGEALIGKENSLALSRADAPLELRTKLGGENPVVVNAYKEIKNYNESLSKLYIKLKTIDEGTLIAPEGTTIQKTPTEINNARNKIFSEIKNVREKIQANANEIENIQGKSIFTKGKNVADYVNSARQIASKYKFPIEDSKENKEYYAKLKTWVDKENTIRKLGLAPVQISDNKGTGNHHVSKDGLEHTLDVEYTLTGDENGNIGELDYKQIEDMVKEGILTKATPVNTSNSEVRKYPTYKYKSKIKINPTAEGEMAYNKQFGVNYTPNDIAANQQDIANYQRLTIYQNDIEAALEKKGRLNKPMKEGSKTTYKEFLSLLMQEGTAQERKDELERIAKEEKL